MVMKKYTFEEVLDMNGDFIAFFRRKVPADKVFKLISCNAEYLLNYFLDSARSGETLDDYFDDKE